MHPKTLCTPKHSASSSDSQWTPWFQYTSEHPVSSSDPSAPLDSSEPQSTLCHLVTPSEPYPPLWHLCLHTVSGSLSSCLACYAPSSVPTAAALPSSILLKTPGLPFSQWTQVSAIGAGTLFWSNFTIAIDQWKNSPLYLLYWNLNKCSLQVLCWQYISQ